MEVEKERKREEVEENRRRLRRRRHSRRRVMRKEKEETAEHKGDEKSKHGTVGWKWRPEREEEVEKCFHT